MVGIIHVGNTLKEPYFEKYKIALEKSGQSYELILWDRKGEVQNELDNCHVYRGKIDGVSKIKKLFAYRKYAKFVQSVLSRKKYDKLILLTTFSALVVGKKIKQYKNNYLFDLRDLTCENHLFFRKKVARIIKNSTISVISSDGFRDVLPDFDYVRAHNLSGENEQVASKQKQLGVIKVGYAGITRGDEFNQRLIRIFGGDNRFELVLMGDGIDSESVKKLANSYQNVKVQGKYQNQDKANLYATCDMIINMNTGGFNGKRLTANKYYDGLLFALPQIARADEYTGALVSCKELGVALDFLDENFADKVYEYYSNLDMTEFLQRATSELDRVKEQNQVFVDAVVDYLSK